MWDFAFTVYLDFDTTTGDSILHDPKKFLIRYSQIYSFRANLELDKIVIYRKFQ